MLNSVIGKTEAKKLSYFFRKAGEAVRTQHDHTMYFPQETRTALFYKNKFVHFEFTVMCVCVLKYRLKIIQKFKFNSPQIHMHFTLFFVLIRGINACVSKITPNMCNQMCETVKPHQVCATMKHHQICAMLKLHEN